MAGNPKLFYLNGRGRMESIRWLLAAAGVEFDEEYLETREQYEKLQKGEYLLFEQVPLVQIDGLNLVQTRAILSYIAGKYNMYGKDLKERVFIDMYVDGTADLMSLIAGYVFLPEDGKVKQVELIKERATKRYFPVYEKVLKDHGQDYLVGNKFSWADVHLLEAILMVEEFHEDILSTFPHLQFCAMTIFVWFRYITVALSTIQGYIYISIYITKAFKERTSQIPTIKKFLQPGSKRKPRPDENYLKTVKTVFRLP